MNRIGVLRHRLILLRRHSEGNERALRADLVSQESRFLEEMALQRAEAQRQACVVVAEFADKEKSLKKEISRLVGEQASCDETCAQLRSELLACRASFLARRKQYHDKLQLQEKEIEQRATDAGRELANARRLARERGHSLQMKVKKYKKVNSVLNRQVAMAKRRQVFLQEAMVERNARLQEYAKLVEVKASDVLSTIR